MTGHESRALPHVLARQQAEEREHALRALLMRPLLPASAPEFASVRRHADALRDWLLRETGWTLHVDRQCARLYKRPATLEDATRGLPGFEREHYVLLCLACAVLERADAQITLRSLGERLLEAAADPELAARGFVYSLGSARERRALVAVCRLLIELGVLERVVGDEDAWLEQSGDVLYDVHRRVLAALPAGTRGASLVAQMHPELRGRDRLAALVDEYVADGAEGRRTALRHRLARRLLDDPVVYHDELERDELEYLASQRGPMAARLAQAVGLVPELRAEGLALVDEDGELTDRRMPATGTDAHVTLLLAAHLAATAREAPERVHAPHELAAFVRAAADRYGRWWRRDAREPGAEVALAEQAVASLAALRLVRRVGTGVVALPALARYSISEA